MSDEIHRLIIQRAGSQEIAKVAIQEGMKTLRMVALDKAREGITSLEQVLTTTSNG